MHPLPRIAAVTCVLLAALSAGRVQAQEFAAVVSPPRFELSLAPGERTRQVIEITNASGQPARYTVRTSDWTLGADAGVTFTDELAPGSCRPWVAIERKEIAVPAGGSIRYRFEVEAPADAPPGECRFAIMVSGEDQIVHGDNGLAMPVTGRIGVIVYVTVGKAAPQLEVVASRVVDVNGAPTPVIEVRNTGNAHGRLDGFLEGKDASGHDLEFAPATLPILPGETRVIPLSPTDEKAKIAWPVRIQGTLEWGDGQRTPFDQQFQR